MADNYFDFIGQNAGEEKKEVPQETQAMANVTVRADADCFLLCDGEYLDIQLDAGKMTKIQVPIGQHLLEFIYTEDANIKVEKVVDFPESGKNYLVLVQGLKPEVDRLMAAARRKAEEEEAQRRAEEEAKRKAEEEVQRKAEEARRQAEEAKRQAEKAQRQLEEARRKAEEEARHQALLQMDFVQKYLNNNLNNIPCEIVFRNNLTDNEVKKAVDEKIRPAADLGNASAQFALGVYYADYGKYRAETLKWYRKAAEQGYARAQFFVGVYYKLGRGVTKDFVEAVKWYRKAAEQGYAPAQCDLGDMYEYGKGVTKSTAEAMKWYRKAAEQGNESAKQALKKWNL